MLKEKIAEKKKIPVKNYVILGLIFALTIGLIIYFCNWYRVSDEYRRQTPVIRGTLAELTSNDELEHYLMENPSAVVYMCTASDMKCRNFEKDFKKLIEKDSLQETIVYLNLSDINQDEFINNFNQKYNYKVSLTKTYPAIVIFEDSNITGILQGTDEEKLTVEKTKQFIDMNKIGE